MSLDALKTAEAKVVGVKQTAKALQKKNASTVFIAADAEERITGPIKAECEKQNVLCVMVDTAGLSQHLHGLHHHA